MKLKLVLAVAFVLTGCAPDAGMEMQYQQRKKSQALSVEDGLRVTITRVGVFKDDVAYRDTRGVYIIYDKQTGKEFIGVSGIGIAETGSHKVGKVQVQDER